MSAEQLGAGIAKLGVRKVKEIALQCDEPYAGSYLELVKRAFPDLKVTEESTTEAGRQQVQGRVMFAVKEPYFQALAKIAFHYYLGHSRRGYRGDEPMFEELRRFILSGGDVGKFIEYTQGRFRPPIGELPSGEVVPKREWCHLLAADETAGSVIVYVQLFVGPGCVRTPCYVTLGKLPTEVVVPDSVWGHAYVYDSNPTSRRYCGRVLPASITRLR